MQTPAVRVTPDEYFALDDTSEGKLEYYDGATVAMAGASPRHNLVAGNIYLALRSRLDPRGCYVAQADQRTRLSATCAWVYPDVVVSCAPRFEGPRPQSLVNPVLVVEVLSTSTAAHDLSAKLAHYRATESITEIVFAHLAQRLVEHHHRLEPAKWVVSLVREGGIDLPGLGSLTIDDVYAGTDRLPADD